MKKLNSEKGFALPVALMLLVVMTLMGAALVTTTSSDMGSNNEKDNSSQAFYAAESGISLAKEWLALQPSYVPDLTQIINFYFVK
jgi:Tfp pilus assembly protein PilX